MQAHHYLAFDLGAESGRAVLGTLADGKLALEEKHRFANPTGRLCGHLHWDLLGQWEELKAGLRKTAAGLSGGMRIDGIGVDTWGVDFGLIGRGGEVLGLPYHYRDARTDGMMEKAFASVGRERIFQTTGIQFMQLNSLYQLLAMRQARSPLLDAAESLLFMPDLFNYLFTGLRTIESSIASTSQMYDPRKKDWAWDLLRDLDLPTNIFGAPTASGTVLGPLQKEVAEECGVDPISVIATTAHDTASAVLAVPAEDPADPHHSSLITRHSPDWCYISSGTWSLMGVELPEPIINDKSLRYNYTNEGGFGGSIRFLKNIMGLWLVQECRRQWQKEGQEHSYAQLATLAAEARPFVAILDPDWRPFLSPGQMPTKIEQFCRETNQKAPATKGEFVRTCLESLALTYRKTLKGLEDVLGRTMRVIHVVGGGSQNELLNQMTADACGVEVIAGPAEATAIGNVLCQAMAQGCVSGLTEARRIVRKSFPVRRYALQNTAAWQQAIGRAG
jgi:rhamnulokinase